MFYFILFYLEKLFNFLPYKYLLDWTRSTWEIKSCSEEENLVFWFGAQIYFNT